MKKLLLLLIPMLALSACKTTEANYKGAYDVAVAKQRERQNSPDDGLDDKMKESLARANSPRMTKYVSNGDTLEVYTMFLVPVDTVGAAPQFSVAMNSFSQVFNARAMCKRLRENGFPGAYVCKNAKSDYYVMSAGSDDVADVKAMLRKATDKGPKLGMATGFPVVLRSAGYRPKVQK